MKKILTTVMAAAASALLMSVSANAAQSVNADISPFEHNIVYTDFYNYATEYPVLMYKNILYVPLTSSMCKELYLSVAFEQGEGLYVARGGGRDMIGTERTMVLGSIDYTNPADGKVTAVIPEYPVYINGRKYENKEYPMLNFRDITYLPLTWDIITNEFDFDFEFDGKKLTLCGNSWYSAPYVIANTDEYIEIKDYKSVYENGDTRYTLHYSYDEYYRVYTADDRVEKLPADYVPVKQEPVSASEPDPRFTVKDGYAYFEDTELVQVPHWSGDGWSYDGYANAEIYDYDDTTFIIVTTGVNIALPRGTTREYHIFVKEGDEIKKLDYNDRFSGFFHDGKNAWYITSSAGEPMWGNSFADIYRYTKENGLERLSDRYENINSLEYIGTHNGKMYVFAALRDGNRDGAYTGESLNPMHSGYYIINEDFSLTKLSPYMGSLAEATLAKNGNLYLITNYSPNNRLINLTTGKIIKTFN